jgi:hypothetical protein
LLALDNLQKVKNDMNMNIFIISADFFTHKNRPTKPAKLPPKTAGKTLISIYKSRTKANKYK